MTDILTKDKNFIQFDNIHIFTDKLGCIDLPYPQKIKIEENPKLFAKYAILEILNQNYLSFCI